MTDRDDNRHDDDRMRERRRYLRVQIALEVMIEMGSGPAQACQVFNMSAGGALVEHLAGARLGMPVMVHIDDFGVLRGHVARVSSTVMALAFENHNAPALAGYIERIRKAARQREQASPESIAADSSGA